MLVGRNDDSSSPHGTTSNHQVCKRQHNAAAIQSPRKIGGFIPHRVVNVYRRHWIAHALVYLLADNTAKHLAMGPKPPKTSLRSSREKCVRTAVIKLGERGCYVKHRAEPGFFTSSFRSQVVDTTGASDSFIAGFLSLSGGNSSAANPQGSGPTPATPPGGSTLPLHHGTCSIAAVARAPSCHQSDYEISSCVCRQTQPCAHPPEHCSRALDLAHPQGPLVPRRCPVHRGNSGSVDASKQKSNEKEG